VSGRSPKSSKPEIVQGDDTWKNEMVKGTSSPFLPETTFIKPYRPPSRLAGEGGLVGMGVSDASVRGLAFGQKPKAVIEVEGAAKIVAPGDVIDGMRVASILSDRIILNDGSVLMFARKSP